MKVLESIILLSNYQIWVWYIFHSYFYPKIARKDSESNKNVQSNEKVNEKVEACGSTLAYMPFYYQLATSGLLSTIPRPRIDATDRRQIEAQNEDKSHTTKEALDDIKRVHYKEKKKKEQNNGEPHQPTILQHLGRSVSRKLITQYEFPLIHYKK